MEEYNGIEHRQFARLDYVTPLAYKVCKEETISKLLEGYTANISQAGLLCKITTKINEGDVLWLSFDRSILIFCEELDKRSLIYQNGVIGKAVRIDPRDDGSYNIGVQFITREEKNLTNIYPKAHFLKLKDKNEKD
jgi:hypothetical protein